MKACSAFYYTGWERSAADSKFVDDATATIFKTAFGVDSDNKAIEVLVDLYKIKDITNYFATNGLINNASTTLSSQFAEAIDDESVTVNGVPYFIENAYLSEYKSDIELGVYGTFYLNAYDEVSYFTKGDNENENYVIRYTLDGKDPNYESELYKEDITISLSDIFSFGTKNLGIMKNSHFQSS